MQVDGALLAGRAADAAVDGEAGVAEGPGHRAACIQACGVLPAHPVQDPAMGVEREETNRMKSRCLEGSRLGFDESELCPMGLHRVPSLYPFSVELGTHQWAGPGADRLCVRKRAREHAFEVEAGRFALGVLECGRLG